MWLPFGFKKLGRSTCGDKIFHPPRFAPNPNFVKRVYTHSLLRRGLHPFVFPFGFFSLPPSRRNDGGGLDESPLWKKSDNSCDPPASCFQSCISCQWFRFCTFDFHARTVYLFGDEWQCDVPKPNVLLYIYILWFGAFRFLVYWLLVLTLCGRRGVTFWTFCVVGGLLLSWWNKGVLRWGTEKD